ncbi:MAG: hypothetical protein ACRD2Z_01450 [Thermoanaerobaculia bacterium]
MRRLPPQLVLGLALVAVVWPLNWTLPGVRTHYLFFPLWLGYVLTVDGLNERLSGTSPWRRSRRSWLLLFVASVPAWWLFEALNLRTGNWVYLGRERFSDFEFAFFASLDFSTVLPAVLETAELLAGRRWLRRRRPGWRLPLHSRAQLVWVAVGTAALAALLLWPRWFYPMIWLGLVPLLLPLAGRRRPQGLTARMAAGDWRPALALALGALTCGVFWELWNFWSFPKWTYYVPEVDFGRLFEMPLLGYLGYLPFGVEVGLLAEALLGARLDGVPGLPSQPRRAAVTSP